MPFYVPLGARGVLMWLGTQIIGITGGFVYWWASRKRGLTPLPLVVTVDPPQA